MNQGPSNSADDSLKTILDHIARPIEFATRSDPARLPNIKNLGLFISHQVVQALGQTVRPAHIEADLLALRELFKDSAGQFSTQSYRSRLHQARKILARLQHSMKTSSGESRLKNEGKTQPSTAYHEVGDLVGKGGKETERLPKDMSAHSSPKSGLVSEGSQPSGDPETQDRVWELPIRFAKGVGPKRAPLFEKLGVCTVEDAFWNVPWRYEDRSEISAISTLVPGRSATISGIIQACHLRYTRGRRMTLLTLNVCDQTGCVEVVFFNQPYLEKLLTQGSKVILSGMVTLAPKGSLALQMRAPNYEVWQQEDDALLHVGRMVSIYHETQGFSSRQMRRIMKGLCDRYLGELEECLPIDIRNRYSLPQIHEAMREIHFPSGVHRLESLNEWGSPAHKRLAFEESFLFQLAMALRRRKNEDELPGIAFHKSSEMLTRLREYLPFQLTDAQNRVIEEIFSDMGRPTPMNRLIQGDVGSGKTIVAVHAMVLACGSGYQAALMAPTEILAEQHYFSMQQLLAAIGLKASVIKGGIPKKERARISEDIREGRVQVVIGTHALLQQDVEFAKLGLVVVDEQHKFGVLQRATLRSKGIHPDVLVMTATPIPRTLAMTAYGDLYVSIIDSLPPGRKPIQTLLYRRSERKRAYKKLQTEVSAGRQAYVVYPLVDESEKVDLEAATQAAERLQEEEFPSFRVGLLHGRMKSDEKANTMLEFKDGKIDILVATTVIEVGMDVPNATVMLIEHADRFGLAQLHQLRGRVGRGADQSLCLLVSASSHRASTGKTMKNHGTASLRLPLEQKVPLGFPQFPGTNMTSAGNRLQAMVHSSDGFVIAEEDLRIRGPGEFLGVRQWGGPGFKVVNLIRDGMIIEQARQEAFSLIEKDPDLSDPALVPLKATLLRRWQGKFDLGGVG